MAKQPWLRFLPILLGFCTGLTGDLRSLNAGTKSVLGATWSGKSISVFYSDNWHEPNTQVRRIAILVRPQVTPSWPGKHALDTFCKRYADTYANRVAIAVVYAASDQCPDANRGNEPKKTTFPPSGTAYNTPNAYAHHIWRWLGLQGPDLGIELVIAPNCRGGLSIGQNHYLPKHTDRFPMPQWPVDSLAAAAANHSVAGFGRIPFLLWEGPVDHLTDDLSATLSKVVKEIPSFVSEAAVQRKSRSHRSPEVVVRQLLDHYGDHLSTVAYIPSLAVMARLRYAVDNQDHDQIQFVQSLVQPYLDAGEDPTPKNGSSIAGHLVFTELASLINNQAAQKKYIDAARRASDLPFKEGKDPLRDPGFLMPFHVEMSDAVFMGGPLLAAMGRLTGNSRYFTLCMKHLSNTRKLNLRSDGIYRHSPLDETAWGRGNGFPALGQALCLSDLPSDFPGYNKLVEETIRHLDALIGYQNISGCWHQIVDHVDSYTEFTSTCMIGFSMARGIRRGWLSEQKYRSVVEKAWHAIRTRITSDGTLFDVCTGTGKQQSVQDYYNRTAILGPDDRGGAMALLFALELHQSQFLVSP